MESPFCRVVKIMKIKPFSLKVGVNIENKRVAGVFEVEIYVNIDFTGLTGDGWLRGGGCRDGSRWRN